jgi:hypothetical protein
MYATRYWKHIWGVELGTPLWQPQGQLLPTHGLPKSPGGKTEETPIVLG